MISDINYENLIELNPFCRIGPNCVGVILAYIYDINKIQISIKHKIVGNSVSNSLNIVINYVIKYVMNFN